LGFTEATYKELLWQIQPSTAKLSA
jgi:hypothetical protein